MKILFLSYYFRPDLCAGSFRADALINAILDQLPKVSHIYVITTLPNRYGSYRIPAPEHEEHPRLTIHRVALSVNNGGMIAQSTAFVDFAKSVMRLSQDKDFDVIFATSGRLMTASLGAYISKKTKKPLYLDIRDIFSDVIIDVVPKWISWLVRVIISRLETYTIQAASKINLVSAGFLPYFKSRYPGRNFVIFTNGIDEAFIDAQPKQIFQNNSEVLQVVYAGNMGDGQGLHFIIPGLARRFEGRLHFKLIGDGGKKPELVSAIAASGCYNVEILPPIERNELIEIYQNADILFLHLNNYESFKKVLPSKLFEYGSLGKPIWAGVGGYAADFLRANIANSSVFSPCNIEEAVVAFNKLELITQPRDTFIQKFRRSKIMKEMAEDIISLARRC